LQGTKTSSPPPFRSPLSLTPAFSSRCPIPLLCNASMPAGSVPILPKGPRLSLFFFVREPISIFFLPSRGSLFSVATVAIASASTFPHSSPSSCDVSLFFSFQDGSFPFLHDQRTGVGSVAETFHLRPLSLSPYSFRMTPFSVFFSPLKLLFDQ